MNNYPEVVKQIHNEFNTAGERLLQESLAIIESAEKVDTQKADRLSKAGFSNTPQFKKVLQVVERTKFPLEMVKIVMDYKQKYPSYKFIRANDVDAICLKYNLTKGNSEQYIGFVPEKNLKDIEGFQRNHKVANRVYVNSVNWTFNHQRGLHKKFLNKLVNNCIEQYDIDRLMRGGFDLKRDHQQLATSLALYYIGEYVGIEEINLSEISPFEICAPNKDMISNKKFNILKSLVSPVFTVVPDPIVLYPVEHGYIIVTAWGDEASDPLVVNEQMN